MRAGIPEVPQQINRAVGTSQQIEHLQRLINTLQSAVVNLQTNMGLAMPEYADNAAAVAAGLRLGELYRTVDAVKVVH